MRRVALLLLTTVLWTACPDDAEMNVTTVGDADVITTDAGAAGGAGGAPGRTDAQTSADTALGAAGAAGGGAAGQGGAGGAPGLDAGVPKADAQTPATDMGGGADASPVYPMCQNTGQEVSVEGCGYVGPKGEGIAAYKDGHYCGICRGRKPTDTTVYTDQHVGCLVTNPFNPSDLTTLCVKSCSECAYK